MKTFSLFSLETALYFQCEPEHLLVLQALVMHQYPAVVHAAAVGEERDRLREPEHETSQVGPHPGSPVDPSIREKFCSGFPLLIKSYEITN